MRSSSFSIPHIPRPEQSLPHADTDRSDARCHTAHMNALPRGSREHSYHKPRFQSPRSAARAEASAKKAPRIVPAILPESVGASHFRLI